MNVQDELTIQERLSAPTPKLFRAIRTICLLVAGVTGGLLATKTQGVELPATIDFLANKAYLLAGAVGTLIAQLTVDVPAYLRKNALA